VLEMDICGQLRFPYRIFNSWCHCSNPCNILCFSPLKHFSNFYFFSKQKELLARASITTFILVAIKRRKLKSKRIQYASKVTKWNTVEKGLIAGQEHKQRNYK
jgi:hypothetical protein